jgi:hypothetical protein
MKRYHKRPNLNPIQKHNIRLKKESKRDYIEIKREMKSMGEYIRNRHNWENPIDDARNHKAPYPNKKQASYYGKLLNAIGDSRGPSGKYGRTLMRKWELAFHMGEQYWKRNPKKRHDRFTWTGRVYQKSISDIIDEIKERKNGNLSYK